MNDKLAVYLCGGINGLTDEQAAGWRDLTKATLTGKFEFLDPMRRDYRGIEDQHVEEIVKLDLEDIDNSDIILCNCARPSWGTAMEIFYSAYCADKYIISIVPKGQKISPWLKYHSTEIVSTLEEAWELMRLKAKQV